MSGWVDEEFATADLGDARLNRRLAMIVKRMAGDPLSSPASSMRGWSEVMAAYRFFDNEKTTVDNVLAPHREQTLARAKAYPRVLHVQDTTELDFTSQKQLKGTGPLAEGPRTGFFSHNELVFSAEGLALGVWHANVYARDAQKKSEKSKSRNQVPLKEKESYRWLEGYRRACGLAEAAPDTQVISCADREGDIYEVFEEWRTRVEEGGKPAEWLVRSSHNRRTNGDGLDQEDALHRKVHDTLAEQNVLGVLHVEIDKRVQKKKIKGGSKVKVPRSKRTAALEVRATELWLAPPCRPDVKLAPVRVWAVRATEKDPPEGEEPIDWILLSSRPAGTFEEAADLLELYTLRWQIEVFHRVLKSGCRVEELQLKHAERARVAIALYMVVAWRVLFLLRLGRACPDLCSEHVFEEAEWKALWTVCHGPAIPEKPPALGMCLLRVAMLGGYLNRKHDGPPGPEALWRGLLRLRDFTLAWRMMVLGEVPRDFETLLSRQT